MDLMHVRRSMMQPKLAYWLCGEDAPINNKWVDRVTKDTWTLYNGASYDPSNKLYLFDTPAKCAALDSSFTDFSSSMDLGHHWMFEFDIYANRYQSNTSMVFLDIGSVTSADKAIGFAVGNKTNKTATTLLLNWKLNGNDSNPFPSTMQHPNFPLLPENEYVHVKGCYRMIDGGDGYDRVQATVNGTTILYETQIPQASYNSWSSYRGYITLGRSVYNHPSTTTTSYSMCCKIHDIKIYIID